MPRAELERWLMEAQGDSEACRAERSERRWRAMEEGVALLTDLYEFTMVDAYLDEGLQDEAVFSLFVRRLPSRRNFLLACGLEEVLQLPGDAALLRRRSSTTWPRSAASRTGCCATWSASASPARCLRRPRGHARVRRGAHPGDRRAAARGAAGGDLPAQPDSPADVGGLQGGARGPGRGGPPGDGLRPAAHPRLGRRTEGGTRGLHRRG